MKKICSSLQMAALLLSILAATVLSGVIAAAHVVSPMFGVTDLQECRQPIFMVPFLEARRLNNSSTTLGNAVVLKDYRNAPHQFLCRSSLVRLA